MSNKEEYKELLEDICSEYCEKDRYCILKEFLISSHSSPRLLMQLKAVDKYKMEKSRELDKDVGWSGAMSAWVEEGYAKKFADVYEEGIKFSVLYKKIRDKNGDK